MSPAARRAAGFVLLAVTLATVCTFLGRWQWNRHVARDAAIATVEANWAAEPVPVEQVLPDPTAALPDTDEWRSVTLTGRYAPQATVLLRNRPVDGSPAYHVLVPFLPEPTSSGLSTVIVVDRGWVPLGEDASATVNLPDPPSGTVTVTVRLRQPERPSTRSAPAGQVQSVDVEQVLAAGGLDVSGLTPYASYGSLVSEDPAPATSLGELPAPSTDPGSHLSYAFQWWVFAAGSLGAFTWMGVREVRDPRPVPGQSPRGPAPVTAAASRRRGGRAEDEEDALIDAQLAPGATHADGQDPAGDPPAEAGTQASEIRSR
ncbi:SURF1 family protein [Cellulomonas soli]|uniref:SURF1 family cytochrome oxidase biogenesis protein n=1 Tax=Cellulomonas soli TaxID=931535 RepID=UPI003F877DD2